MEFLIISMAICAAINAMIASTNNMNIAGHAVLGLLFGIFGVLITAMTAMMAKPKT